MELRTRPIQQQEDRILSQYALAQDADDNVAICRAELSLYDFYTRAGCLSPDAALLASLIIAPAALETIRQILPDSTVFDNAKDRRLYEAMLCTPCTSLDTWWPLLAKIAGLPLAEVLAYMNYDFFNCAHVSFYAAQLLNRWVYNAALQQAQRIIEDFNNGQTMAALDHARAEFGALADRLNAARPLLKNGAPRRWGASFSEAKQ